MEFFIQDKQQYLNMVQTWKDRVHKGESIHPIHHLIYNCIRTKDPKRGFTPITKQRKIDAGHRDAWDLCFEQISRKYSYRQPWNNPFMFGLDTKEYDELCGRIVLYVKTYQLHNK